MAAKFKLGEVVYLVAGLADVQAAAMIGCVRLPKALTIISVFTEECHGGTQFHYGGRLDGNEAQRFNETELAASDSWSISDWIKTVENARKSHPLLAELHKEF